MVTSTRSTRGRQLHATFTPVWDKLVEEKATGTAASTATTASTSSSTSSTTSASTTVLVVGRKKAGKTTLIERFINPTKEDFPKPTAALDYKFVRQDSGTGKTIAHLYDCSQEPLADMVIRTATSPAAASQQTNFVCCVVLDGGEPGSIMKSLLQWTAALRSKITTANRPDLVSPETQKLYGISIPEPESSTATVLKALEGHSLRPFPVPLLICISKYDLMVSKMDAERRKLLLRGLRFFSHLMCAHLVTCAAQEKQAMNSFRSLLKPLLFSTASTAKASLDMTKPLCVPAGSDSFEKVGPPLPGAAAEASVWQKLLDQEIGREASSTDGGGGAEQLTDADLARFGEASVDGMVDQKRDELVQYKRAAERRLRLQQEK
ncbi:unnamed protein product [Amoebophrya sp. A25]|nr:unnamed protein product [Amoebophrya sp. A25]|eukprot:GSA25T00017012001.1